MKFELRNSALFSNSLRHCGEQVVDLPLSTQSGHSFLGMNISANECLT
jgi:hypothetical protein